tara:strand:- start:48 stop:248 length:201 start_codon:yes stop_codon:yes gene_type:complete
MRTDIGQEGSGTSFGAENIGSGGHGSLGETQTRQQLADPADQAQQNITNNNILMIGALVIGYMIFC